MKQHVEHATATSKRRSSRFLPHFAGTSGLMRLQSTPRLHLHTTSTCPPDYHPGPILPTELCHKIIDLAADPIDRPSLLACALVCRAWLPRCCQHLFSTIHLRTLRQLQLLSHTISQASNLQNLVKQVVLCPPGRDAAEFLPLSFHILAQFSPGVTLSVVPLALCSGTVFLPRRDRMRSFTRRRKSEPEQCVELALDRVAWKYEPRSELPAYRSVTTLKLCYNTFLDFSDLPEV
ncbi:hypothetical protein OBBRIDRAFT_90696 [Obba rivulosa]|uniref:F-box domain-containing protein n=1 Tax=Obba rivulosa TaxID=1052685 RepID=A0A8E2AQ87_9APHY|nr:hypothetical protein OBBRIDRAFT_90696 [Obba rivulosa]